MRYCDKCLVQLNWYKNKPKEEKEIDASGLEKIYFICPNCEKEFEKLKALNQEQYMNAKFAEFEKRIEKLEKEVM